MSKPFTQSAQLAALLPEISWTNLHHNAFYLRLEGQPDTLVTDVNLTHSFGQAKLEKAIELVLEHRGWTTSEFLTRYSGWYVRLSVLDPKNPRHVRDFESARSLQNKPLRLEALTDVIEQAVAYVRRRQEAPDYAQPG